MRIGQKLILGFVTIALLVGVVGYLAVNTSQKTLQKTIGESSVSLAAEILDQIDKNMFNKIERFQSFQDPSLQETITNSNQEFEKLDNIQEYINEKDREWTSAPKEEITPFMRDLINNRLSKALRKRAKFHEEKYGFRDFAELFVTNKYGANIAQTGKTTDYRQDDEQWWQRAKEDGLYVADVKYDESADVYSTDIGIRIDDETGNFVGVLKAVLNIEEAINIVKEAEAMAEYHTMEFKLLTKDGRVIYSTEDFELLEDIPRKLLSHFRGEDKHEHTSYFIAQGDKPGEDQELIAHVRSRGYKDFKGLGWILIVEHKTKEIFAPAAQLRNDILIISSTATILAVLLGLLISTSISKPVKELRDAAAKIGEGNLNSRIEVRSNDEIGQLAQSFNDMAEDLKKTTASRDELNAANQQLDAGNQQLRASQQQLQANEQQLKASNQQLQSEIAERKQAEKKQAELFEELESVNQQLTDFAHIVSHDLKAPLHGIKTLADWISTDYADKLDEEGREQMKLLTGRVERMRNLINGVLQYSKISRDEEEKVPVNLNELLSDVIDMVDPPENIAITVEDELPVVQCGETRIMQVFQNLLSNAVKYMDKPQGRIKIGCAEEDDFWKFSVTDNGPGIEEKYFERIFKIFQTLLPRDEFESTGVGLTVAKKIVELYGGKIWVQSEPGEGSTFFFSLPKQKMGVKNAKLEANIAC